MSRYEMQWPCCGDISITDAWEPDECPFCAKPPTPAAEVVAWALKFPGDGGRLCLSTVFDMEQEARDYAERCESVEVVALALASRSESPAARPNAAGQEQGWQWVPVEPTEEMMEAAQGAAVLDAGMASLFRRGLLANWRDMLAAAPPLEAVGSKP